MHPTPAFRWPDDAAMHDFVRAIAFGGLFCTTPDGPRVAHCPAVLAADGSRLAFHLSRANALVGHLDGATALFVVQGPDAYVSPDWYGLGANQVPTWNYLSVEVEGQIRQLDAEATLVQIDALAARHEAPLAPKPPWTRAKADPAYVDKLLRGIVGYTLTPTVWRGTRKLGQTKPAAARAAVATALDERGNAPMAALMRAAG